MGRTGKVRAVVGLGLLAFVLAPAVLEEVFTPVGNITKLPHFRVSEGAMRTLASSRQ